MIESLKGCFSINLMFCLISIILGSRQGIEPRPQGFGGLHAASEPRPQGFGGLHAASTTARIRSQ